MCIFYCASSVVCLSLFVARGYIVTTSILNGSEKGSKKETAEKGCGATRGSSCEELNVSVGGMLVSLGERSAFSVCAILQEIRVVVREDQVKFVIWQRTFSLLQSSLKSIVKFCYNLGICYYFS